MTVISELFEIWNEMISAVFKVIPTAISFALWIISAILILPCVFVAGQIYPKWTEWGEKF